MIVPFDRLYDFCDQMVQSDTIIYVFKEHGNKKVTNIEIVNPKWQWTVMSFVSKIPMIMHDQEPLNFDLYNNLPDSDLEELFRYHFDYFKYLVDRVPDTPKRVFAQVRNKNLKVFLCLDPTIYDTIILCHSEKNSQEVAKYEQHGYVGCYWWNHAVIARDWYRFAEADYNLNFSTATFAKDFNIYNRAWTGTREYRLKFLELLLDNNLVQHSNVAFNPVDQDQHYTQHQFRNPAFCPQIKFNNLPLNTSDATASADYNARDYNICAIDVVLETLFDDQRIHLTEKTLRPIACGKPFILVGPCGSLDYLKQYGFKTFGDIIDESYDSIQDPVTRLRSIANAMKTFSAMPNKSSYYKHLHELAQFNKARFWSDDFLNFVVDEFKTNYAKAREHCNSNAKGRDLLDNINMFVDIDPEWKTVITNPSISDSESGMDQVLDLIKSYQ